MTILAEAWDHFSDSPLFGPVLTLASYQAAALLSDRLRGLAIANPVLLAIGGVVLVLWLSGTSYDAYFAGARYIHLLLAPATVALAVPLHSQLARIRQSAPAVLAAVTAGGAAAAASAVAIAWSLGASSPVIRSLAPKSVTTPIAMGVSAQIGGLPDLTAVLVILTGIAGAVLSTAVLDLLGIECRRARGLAAGVAGQWLGTARMLGIDETAGAFAGIGMGLCGLETAVLLPTIALACR